MEKRIKYTKVERFIAAVLIVAMMMPNLTSFSYAEGTDNPDDGTYCGIAAHTHTQEGCYTEERTLICGRDEAETGHVHTEECYEAVQTLVCELEENEEHTHGEECYATNSVLICELPETETHQHTEECYSVTSVFNCQQEEHQHTLSCYSNPNADVETASQWEASFQNVELTGDWDRDVVEIAKSQLGYEESTANYIVDSENQKQGYTRYGAWYGQEEQFIYGDWCAMFVSFCLYYARVENVPFEASCTAWVQKLKESGLYRENDAYTPKAGDIVFFDLENTGEAGHVGIVVEVTDEGIRTIEGNIGPVQYVTYKFSENPAILGYGELPENPDKNRTAEKSEVSLTADTDTPNGTINLGTYSQALCIPNYLYYSKADKSGWIAQGGNSVTLSGTSAVDVVIGAENGVTGDDKPMASDIKVSLSELTMPEEKTMTIRPVVYEGGDYKVDMTISAASNISNLKLEANACLTVTMKADLTISKLDLGESSGIEFILNGHTLTVTESSGTGNMSISGTGKVTGTYLACGHLDISDAELKFKDIRANGTMNLKNATLHGDSSGKITASGNIVAQNSTISGTALFGYDEKAAGNVVMNFTGCTFSGVAVVGAGTGCNAQVTFDENNSVSTESGTSYVRDYAITYKAGETTLSPGPDWITSYRVSFTAFASGMASVLGAGTNAGFNAGLKKLPSYTKTGYGYGGWKMDDQGDAIKELSDQTGDLTLHAVLVAGTVAVTMDLGFAPGEDNSDDYQTLNNKYTIPSDDRSSVSYSGIKELGETLTLDNPQRFGYIFKGWKILKGETERGTYTDSYTIELDDLIAVENEENCYSLHMAAQWEADTFPINMTFAGIDLEYIELSMNGGATWGQPGDAVKNDPRWSWDGTSRQIRASINTAYIQYGETLGAYFERLGLKYPQVRDARLNASDSGVSAQAKSFRTWSVGVHDMSSEVIFNTEMLLTEKGSRTWNQYQSDLKLSPVTLVTNWGTMNYALSVPEVSGWSYYINDEPAVPEDGVLQVPTGAKVTFASTVLSGEKQSVWSLKADNQSPLYMDMREYHAGDSSYFYDFVMPASNVTAAYGKGSGSTKRYIDIAKSPITFAEDISYRGRTGMTGFWYGEKIETIMMPLFGTDDISNPDKYGSVKAESAYQWYFYEFDFGENFYLTSNKVATQNQLTLISGMNIYLKDCNLIATSSYSSAFLERKINGILMESISSTDLQTNFGSEGCLSSYGNIVIDNSHNYKYTTNLYVAGDNTVASIIQSKLNTYANYYGTLNIYGNVSGEASGQLELGSAFMNGIVQLSNLSVEAYVNDANPDGSEYLLYTVGSSSGKGDITISDCNIHAAKKYIHAGAASVIAQGSSKIYIGNVYGMQEFKATGASYTRVYGDLMTWRGLGLSDSSNLVIDGNLIAGSHSASQKETATVNSSGYLIVKGNRCEFANFNIKKGTIIANDVSVGYQGEMSGGTIITNHLMNYGTNNPEKNRRDGNYNYTPATAQQTVPFYTFSNPYSGITSYTFSGGEMYLFGAYKKNGNLYNLSVNATDSDNPVAGILEPLLDGDGNLSADGSALTSDKLKQAFAGNAANNNNECVILGNSEYNNSTRKRTVNISGTGIYASGHVNFFNDVNMTDGAVECAGHFSSALDMTISGGQVDAAMVGNSDRLIYTDSVTKMSRWQKTTISDEADITTERVGALSSDNTSRSTLDITGGTLKTHGENPVQLVHDVYIDYILGDSFEKPDGNPETLRFSGTWSEATASLSGVKLKLVADNLSELPEIKITEPAGGFWMLDSLSGSKVNKVGADGKLHNDAAETILATAVLTADGETREYLPLYAVKDTYKLTVKEGADVVNTIMSGNDVLTLNGENSASVKPGNSVCMTLNDTTMKDKIVVWYYDAAGLLHNVNPEITENSSVRTEVSFTMPAADVEVFITDELKLYLNQYEIAFQDAGFRVEFEKTREDSTFSYGGSYRITQSNLLGKLVTADEAKSSGTHPVVSVAGQVTNTSTNNTYLTKNRLKFEGSNMDASRNISHTITLEKVLQDYASADSLQAAGLIAGDGLNIAVKIDGVNQLCVTDIPEHSQIYLYGDSNTEDKLCIQSRSFNRWDMGFISTYGDKPKTAGSAYLKNLNIMQLGNIFAIAKSFKTDNESTVTLENCVSRQWHYYAGSGIVAGYKEANLINCNFDIYEHSDTSSAPFGSTKTVNIKDTHISYQVGGGRNGMSLFNGVTAMNITGTSAIDIKDIYTKDTLIRNVTDDTGCTVTLKDEASITADRRLRLRKLIMEGSSRFTVIGTSGGGYLFCPDITVNGGTLTADYIINSGYNSKSSNEVTAVKSMLANFTDIISGAGYDGLRVNGGEVTVNEFAGGNRHSKITVTGGVLNVNRAGTTDTLYGIAYYTPKENEEYVYTYNRIPKAEDGAEICITGGTVNVRDGGWLGGMNAEVKVSGGEVKLREGSVLGITEEQKTELGNYYSSIGDDIARHKETNIKVNVTGGKVEGTGAIHTPYGMTDISGNNTGVCVQEISALNGKVTISDAEGQYVNPLTGHAHTQVGVQVTKLLTAQDIIIQNGAVVYAKKATSNAADSSDSGVLQVGEKNNPAYLYSEIYGSDGEGAVTITGKDEGYIIGGSQYSIHYYLMDDTVDRAMNSSENPLTFEYQAGTSETITLHAPERNGYEFMGWYSSEEDALAQSPENKVTAIHKNVAGDVSLYAAWKPLEVTFQIVIDTTSMAENWKDEIIEGTVQEGNGMLIFNKTVSVAYLDRMFGDGENHITLSDFNLPSYTVETLRISEDGWSGTTDDLDQIRSVVTNELLQFYLNKKITDSNAVITLKAGIVAKKNQKLTMNLNLNEQARPINAAFQENTDSENQPTEITATTISSLAPVGATVSAASGFVIKGYLNQPTAPGYTFNGWYTDSACTKGPINESYGVGNDYVATFYAKWTPNEYLVVFDAGENGKITDSKDEMPDVNDSSERNAYVTYDTVIDGHISYSQGEVKTNSLPWAWKDGCVFLGWSADGGKTLIKDEELNRSTFADMNLEDTSNSALTLKAVYRSVQVTYMTDGGQFTSEWLKKAQGTTVEGGYRQEEVVYGEALAGYTENVAEDKSYELLGTVQVKNTTYGVVSTTNTKYEADKAYVSNDYRNVIGKKGYTFLGWNTRSDGQGATLGAVPQYEDITVYAQWRANKYTLNLNEGTSSYSKIEAPDGPKTVTVVVGEEIKTDDSVGINVDDWPARSGNDAWYAYDKTVGNIEENDKRFLLGFTFDSFEPGALGNENKVAQTAYYKYANQVMSLLNINCLFTKAEGSTAGSIFALPDDKIYSNRVFETANIVPDYPDRSTINMYAIYRERSLVFVERYVNTDTGETVQEVFHSAPYYTYDAYPETYKSTGRQEQIESHGYTLTGWYVNSKEAVSGREYSKENYTKNQAEWLKQAMNMGTYDIMVYTVYAAQAKKTGLRMTASVSPEENQNIPSYRITSCEIPKSISVGTVAYEIPNTDQLNIVSLDELKEMLYDADKANNTVAIKMELIDSQMVVQETFWLDERGGKSTKAIGAGWQIKMTLYHSHVISKEKTYHFDMEFTFPDLPNQSLTLEGVEVNLAPTRWTVKYTAAKPQDDNLVVKNSNGFALASGDDKTYVLQVNDWVYGTELKNAVPELEGYTGNGNWKYINANNSEETFEYGEPGKMTLTAANAGVIQLSTDYTANTYQLSAGNGVLDKWKISCETVNVMEENIPVDVTYHKKVTIEPEGTQEAAYIWLTVDGQKYRLDELTANENQALFHAEEKDGVYSFLMPASDVAVEYNDVMLLYLEKGSIHITEDGYTQDGVTNGEVKWPGAYQILQNETNDAANPTPNVLTLAGELSGRTIKLGNLNISSDDSIKLEENTKAELKVSGAMDGLDTENQEVTAKNILVPATAELTMTSGLSDGAKMNITLKPETGKAAIGENEKACGSITLNQLNLNLIMPAGSEASGIGSGNENGSEGTVSLTDCIVAVTEESNQTSGPYQGVWLGGQSVAGVILDSTKVTLTESHSAGTIVDGGTVTLTGSSIGSSEGHIADHYVKGGDIIVHNSQVFLSASGGSGGSAALLAAEKEISIDLTETDKSIINITGSFTNLYEGTMKLHSEDSDVVIGNTRIADVNNGNITITETDITQNKTTHLHSGNYLLLSEFADNTGSSGDAGTSNVTVTSLAGGRTITAGDDASDEVKITNLTVNSDMALVPTGTVTVDGTTTIASGMTLSVSASDAGKMEFTKGFHVDGNYEQNGGRLSCGKTQDPEAGLIVDGNMTLTNVTTTASGQKVGSSGAGDVTTVTINGGSVTAETIGALGEHNQTFTFVKLEKSPQITGTVIQDHYRLKYILNDPNYNSQALPVVLRSASEYTGGSVNVTYSPDIPGNPDYTAGDGQSYFGNWYVITKDSKNIALSRASVAGFDEFSSLTERFLDEAKDTETEDGTKTLDVYAWMKLRGEGVITYGRQLNPMSDVTDKKVAIETNGAWTAQFTVKGTVISGSEYQFNFSTELPAGTKLTLADRSEEGTVKWYYYIVPESGVRAVPVSAFVQMGGEACAAGPSGTDGEAYEDILQLSADFSDTKAAVSGTAVSLVLKTSQAEQNIAAVEFTAVNPASASVTASDSQVNIFITQRKDYRLNGKNVYLVAELTQDGKEISVPYGAVMNLKDSSGQYDKNGVWIGGNKVVFDLGKYAETNASYTWTTTGLAAGTYSVVWSLTAANSDTINVFDALLANCQQPVSFTIQPETEPSLKVTLDSIDSAGNSGRVLAKGTEHVLSFSYDTNADSISVTAEKQGLLANFKGAADNISSSGNMNTLNGTVTVTFGTGTPTGTYRLRFSMKDASTNDDVYYTFIVE